MSSDSSSGGSAPPAAGPQAAFVDALYRKVLLLVKASNAIPSEDEDFHFHRRFNAGFAAASGRSGDRVQELLWALRRSHRGKKARGGDEEDDDEEEREGGDPFDGPEPRQELTDLVDGLLDDASRQLEIAARGETTAPANRPLENAPMVFEMAKSKGKDEQPAPSTKQHQPPRSRATHKPQDKFEETIDNSPGPFVSKLREKVHSIHDMVADEEVDETVPRHPYHSEIRALKYASWQLEAASTPYPKVPVEEASYLWVDTNEKLEQMMARLRHEDTRVIAVDLEHHSYRTYLGLLCLMQISTATEDFLVDTLALRSRLQVLNEVFCDPAKVKVLHGADMDILWLQRDLGVYVVNMFDTGQAARLLNYARFSLAYLLKRHCGIDADKQYQLADWRVRPLDRNMVKYAREDTRYLLYIYDQMKQELLSASDTSRSSLLFEALQNSSKICLQVYEKPEVSDGDCEALSDKLKGTVGIPVLSELQRRVFAELYYWRDRIARAEDESHAYVMPNQVLIKITKSLPLRSDQLFRTCNPVPQLVRKHAHELTTMIANEKSKLAAEEGKKPAPSMKPVAVPQKRKFDDVNELRTSPVSVKELSEHTPWRTGIRFARAIDGGERGTGSLPLGCTPALQSTTASCTTDADSLQKVREMLAQASFVVKECQVEEEPVVDDDSRHARAPVKSNEPEMPKSLAETYQLSTRTKRRKMDGISVEATNAMKDRAGAFIQQAVEETQQPKAFDYAAASQSMTGAQFKLDETPLPSSGGPGKKKKRTVGSGYNPFVAVRGGKSAEGEEKKGKGPVKKIHHMPRSATFR